MFKKRNMLTNIKTKLTSFREYFCRGGFNVPTEKQIDDAPLVLPEPKLKLAVSESKIDAASNTSFIKSEIVTGGIRGWLRGDFNLPTTKEVDGWKAKPSFKFRVKDFLKKIR